MGTLDFRLTNEEVVFVGSVCPEAALAIGFTATPDVWTEIEQAHDREVAAQIGNKPLPLPTASELAREKENVSRLSSFLQDNGDEIRARFEYALRIGSLLKAK